MKRIPMFGTLRRGEGHECPACLGKGMVPQYKVYTYPVPTGVQEASSMPCSSCNGTGRVALK